jgi:hypothetical protein
VVAYRSLSDLDNAGRQLETLLALEGAEAYRQDSLKKLGIVFLKEAAERDERGDPDGAQRSRRVALRVYERMLEDIGKQGAGAVGDDAIAGVERLIEGLRVQLGETGAPADP